MVENDENEEQEEESIDSENNNDDASNSNSTYSRIDHFWKSIFQMKDRNNLPKYSALSSLIKALVTLAHGNADCERGFSINSTLLESRSKLNLHSINGLRQVKSHMQRNNNDIVKLKIDRDLLNAAKNSFKNYRDLLEKEKFNHQKKRKVNTTLSKLQELSAEENELQNKFLASQTM